MDYVNVKTDQIYNEGVIVGNSTDPAAIQADTDVMQQKLNLSKFFDDPRPLFFPWTHYRFNSVLTVPERVRIYGETRARQYSSHGSLNRPTVFDFVHQGTGMEIHGDFVEIKNIVFRGNAAQGDAIGCLNIAPGDNPQTGAHSSVQWCHFYRPGGLASVRIRRGGGEFIHNKVVAHFNPFQPSFDSAALRPARHHALWCPSLADHHIASNDLTGDGAGLYASSCGGLNIHDNFIYNSNVGIYFTGVRTSSFADNRVDEHWREGFILDWNSYGNTILGNRFHCCGARTTEAAVDRVGLLLRSGEANNISTNIFDNWDHDVQQPGGIDYRSPQQYGIRVKGVGAGSQHRPLPQYNLIGMNTFRNQKSGNILDEGDTTNKFIGNVGRDFPGGLYSDSSPEPVTAGFPSGPASAVAATAAAVVAFRNRGNVPAADT